MDFVPFDKQEQFLCSNARIKAALAGKRGGKTEVGAIQSILLANSQDGYDHSEIDPYVGVIIAPTTDMLRRLSMKKFLAYAKPFNPNVHQTHNEVTWPNGTIIYGISADKPERLEGIKANYIWLDEVLQMPEQIFLESLARVADTRGKIFCTGSLGVQYTNPKNHWVYKFFVDTPLDGAECFTWATLENPYFPADELERLKGTLDQRTFKALFELSWDVQASNLVYDELTDENIKPSLYNPQLETYISIDWGWTHPAACLFIQYDQPKDTVYVIDEIVGSKMTLEQLYLEIKKKPYRIKDYYCDIAGNQEREQTGISNIAWFKQPPRNIHFRYRTMAISHSIAIVRSYVKNMKGKRRLYIDPKCKKLIDGLKNYSYQLKDGRIESELPIKNEDDAVDSLRYFFGNRLDFSKPKDTFVEFSRWKAVGK